jgi:uncharacterized surface protein with fasciclin (FAS1) repeats
MSSLVLTRNSALRNRYKELRKIDPESGNQWEKYYLPKTERDSKLYGWYHNQPYHNWNNKAYYAFSRATLRATVVSHVFMEHRLSRFAELLRMSENSVLHELSTPGPWTVFAPVNSAFDRLIGGWEDFRMEADAKPLQLRRFLRQHASRGIHKLRGDHTFSSSFTSLENASYRINIFGSFEDNDRRLEVHLVDSAIPPAAVESYDNRTSNGYVHVIDSVLGFSKTKNL